MLVGGPVDARILNLVYEGWKKLEMFEMHIYFGPGAQIMFRYERQNFDTGSFLFFCVCGYGCVNNCVKFFSSKGSV